MKCQCPLAGYCETHKREMSPAFWKLCHESDAYFDAFQKPPRTSIRGLGDMVAAVTSAVGIKPCDECKKRQEKLNELFPFGDSRKSP